MTDPVADFVAYHAKYNRLSREHTRKIELAIRRLEEFLSGPITEITARDLEEFLVALDVKANTILHYLNYYRPFWKWLHRHGLISAEQLISLSDIKAPPGAGLGEPRPYSKAELANFWAVLDVKFPWTGDPEPVDHKPSRGEYWVERWVENPEDRYFRAMALPYARRLQVEAMIALGLFGGMRRVEMFKLTVADCHYPNAYIRCRGARKNAQKEERERVVPMVDPLRMALANWQEFRAQIVRPEHDKMWCKLWGPDYATPMSFRVFARQLEGVGSLHRLRHTYATERLRSGMDPVWLQKLMGHSSLQMVLRYAEINDEDVLREAMKTNDKFTAALAREGGV